MTDKPFGVNVSLFPALMPRPADELIDQVIQAGIKIIETAGRSPAPYRDQIKDAGLTHIHKCARVRDAIKVDGLGVDIVSIVKPATFLKWIREKEQGKDPKHKRLGRPLTSEEVVKLVLRIHEENAGWGHKKIHGELMKLGVKLSKTSVYNILKEQGKEPGPSRECLTWSEFLSQHMQTLWACDFLPACFD